LDDNGLLEARSMALDAKVAASGITNTVIVSNCRET
jgi:hypothetical protein